METFWFVVLAAMFAVYVVLDGFDFGAGIVHLLVAKNERQRRITLRSIGPFWDGNEVWLIAGGGVLFFAFPLLYASAFSGFYLALIMVLWLLMLRGVSLELRNHIASDMWKQVWDFLFGVSSLLLALLFGTALGNVVRGVNLGGVAAGEAQYELTYFFAPLWTNFLPGDNPGTLDWFTVLMGVIAVLTLAIHGGNWIVLKSEGAFQETVRGFIKRLWWGLLPLVLLSIGAIYLIRPVMFDNYLAQPLWAVVPLAGLGALLSLPYWIGRKAELPAFVASSAFIVMMLLSTAIGLFPVMLPSTNALSPDITIYNAANTAYGLNIALRWWILALVLVCGYFFYVHRVFRGKIALDDQIYESH